MSIAAISLSVDEFHWTFHWPMLWAWFNQAPKLAEIFLNRPYDSKARKATQAGIVDILEEGLEATNQDVSMAATRRNQ